jgi:phosphoribosylglycinamide formyltransferase-1
VNQRDEKSRQYARVTETAPAVNGPRDESGSLLRIGLIASHDGTTAQAVIDACASGAIAGRVALIISNNADSGVLRRAQNAGIEWCHLSGKTHPEPTLLDAAICDALRSHQVNVVALVGYMKRLGPVTLHAFEGRIVNTHPALLPRFGGQGMFGDRVHEAVLASGDRVSGATVHLVTAEYDAGRILRQATVSVLPDDDTSSLGSRVRAAEKELLIETLNGWDAIGEWQHRWGGHLPPRCR